MFISRNLISSFKEIYPRSMKTYSFREICSFKEHIVLQVQGYCSFKETIFIEHCSIRGIAKNFIQKLPPATLGTSHFLWVGGGGGFWGGGHPKIFELKGGASQKLNAEEFFFTGKMYWFDGALKGKLEGGGVHAKFFRDNKKPPPPLPIKNERSLMIIISFTITIS